MNNTGTGAREGIPLLLLKTRSTPNDGYEEKFSTSRVDEFQFQPTFVPVLEHKFLDNGLDVVRFSLRTKKIGRYPKAKYGGLIFTSQRAVEAFAKVVDEGKGFDLLSTQTVPQLTKPGPTGWPHLNDIPIYTVGPATCRALRSINQTPPLNIFGSDTGNGEALAHYIIDHYGSLYEDREVKPPLLFLVGEQRRDIIPKTLMDQTLPPERRVQVDELVVYGTGVMESFEVDFSKILDETKEAPARWAVVFSPTGCEAMLRALDLLDPASGKAAQSRAGDRSTFVATIGPTTRDFLKENFGFEPDVCAEKPSPDGVEEGIKRYMQDRS